MPDSDPAKNRPDPKPCSNTVPLCRPTIRITQKWPVGDISKHYGTYLANLHIIYIVFERTGKGYGSVPNLYNITTMKTTCTGTVPYRTVTELYKLGMSCLANLDLFAGSGNIPPDLNNTLTLGRCFSIPYHCTKFIHFFLLQLFR